VIARIVAYLAAVYVPLSAPSRIIGRCLREQEFTDATYPQERLIACRNPLLAVEGARKREALLQATERELDAIVQATTRTTRRLIGQAAIALRVGKVRNRFRSIYSSL
jgi:hypothetical protein